MPLPDEGLALVAGEVLRLWSNYPEAHYNFAILLESATDRAGAATHYQQAIRSRPDYIDARLRYAGLLALSGNWVEAQRQYDEVLKLRPGYPEAHNNYGVFLEKRGDVASAETHYIHGTCVESSMRLGARTGEWRRIHSWSVYETT
jgi:tetratricopeptide (TPR) repeat protein